MSSPNRVAWCALLALAACASPAPPPYTPVADVKLLMAGVVEPAAEVYWDAVGETEDSTGVHQTAPTTDEAWTAVRNGALTVAESGNLLMLAGRAKDSTEWMTLARQMTDAGRAAMLAAERRDTKAVFDAGAVLYDTCTACHAKYAVQVLRPNAKQE